MQGPRRQKKGQTRSPHYFVQITQVGVICEIPVILHFKLENKTAWLAAAYPHGGISMLSPPVTLTLPQASRARLLWKLLYCRTWREYYFFLPPHARHPLAACRRFPPFVPRSISRVPRNAQRFRTDTERNRPRYHPLARFPPYQHRGVPMLCSTPESGSWRHLADAPRTTNITPSTVGF